MNSRNYMTRAKRLRNYSIISFCLMKHTTRRQGQTEFMLVVMSFLHCQFCFLLHPGFPPCGTYFPKGGAACSRPSFRHGGGFRMEEEERGCVRVRLVSGCWRGALGIGGEEHTGCTPPAGGEEEQQQPVEAVPSQPSHPEHNLD